MLISMRWRLQVYFEWSTTFSREKTASFACDRENEAKGYSLEVNQSDTRRSLFEGEGLGSLVGHKFPRAPDAVMSRS